MKNLDAIFSRRSVRTYLKTPVSDELVKKLIEAYAKYPRLNDLRQRIAVMPTDKVKSAMTGIVGSYGSMKNPPYYAIGVCECGQNDQVAFGYVFEHFMLECVKEGLGACWVGGFFKKSILDQLVSMHDNERIICVAPFGYAAKPRFAERTMRSAIKADGRAPFDKRFFHDKWGRGASAKLPEDSPYRKLFEAARWSPSASNMQPCHYIYDEKRIVLCVLTTLQKKYPDVIAKDRAEDLNFQNVDAGIAMAHITIAGRELGISGQWTLNFEEPLLHEKYAIIPEARIVGVYELS